MPAQLHCLSFSQRIYHFRVAEDSPPFIGLGEVRAMDVGDADKVRFQIVQENGDEERPRIFAFDEIRPNKLILEGELEADKPGGDAHLLNIKVRPENGE
jgi:hypothetical protein